MWAGLGVVTALVFTVVVFLIVHAIVSRLVERADRKRAGK